jgi:hypothetical protein
MNVETSSRNFTTSIVDTNFPEQTTSNHRNSDVFGIFLKCLPVLAFTSLLTYMSLSGGRPVSSITASLVSATLIFGCLQIIPLWEERSRGVVSANLSPTGNPDPFLSSEIKGSEVQGEVKPVNNPRPCYIPNPERFSLSMETARKDQELFQGYSNLMIEGLSEQFQGLQKEEPERIQYWNSLTKFLGYHRCLIAKSQGTRNKEDFGVIRNCYIATLLDSQYEEYGETLQRKILDNLPKLDGSDIIVRDGQVELRIVKWMSTFKEEQDLFSLNLMQRCKTATSSWNVIVSLVPDDQKGSSEMISCAVLPFVDDVVKERPTFINRVPSTQLKEVLVDSFFECISTSSLSIEELKGKVAKFRYFFAHASIYLRGSAAIGEWIEKAIYKSHGLSLEYKYPTLDRPERPLADLDAFLSFGPSEFIADYCEKAHVS